MRSVSTFSWTPLFVAVVGDAGRDAEEVLQWMEQLGYYPNTLSYSTAISAWGKSRDPNAPERAEAILRHSIKLHTSGARSHVAPSGVTFSAVIHAWSASERSDATEKCLAVLELMKTLYDEKNITTASMTVVFNSLIGALSKTAKEGDAGDKALELLEHMEKLKIPKDAGTHNLVVSALMKSRRDGPQRAIEYFQEIESKYNSGDEDVQLDGMSYNIALNALSRTDRELAPNQAMELLQRMIENDNIEPTTPTFNTVMKILARSPLEDSALRCEQLLEEMQRRASPESIRPSTITYSTCISAWGYTRSPERYDRMSRLLHQMIDSYKAGNSDAKPNFIPFNSVLIGCCCHSDDREMALACVLKTMDLLRRTVGVRVHQTTYPLVFRAIALNSKKGERRNSLLLNEFENCVQDGLVSPECVETIEHASSSLLISLWPVEATSLKDSVPSHWKRNVQKTNRIR